MSKLVPPLKWHGGKHYLAKQIIELMPPRCKKPNAPDADDPGWLHYVEPYFGGGAVLLANDPEGISEVANDIHGELTNFWRTLQNVDTYHNFKRIVEAIPFSQVEFEQSQKDKVFGDDCDIAVSFFVRCRQSLSGRMGSFAGITRNRTRSGMNEQVSAWLNVIEGLPSVHARLKRVLVLNRSATKVIEKEDGPRTLFYLDPPYLHETRATTGEYEHEMTETDHATLLSVLATLQGRFLLSGYRSWLYDHRAELNGWKRHDFELPNNAAGGKEKRRMVESVWCNF